MRNQLKPSPIDPLALFNFEDKELEKGLWTIVYKVPPRDSNGVFDFNKLLTGVAYKCDPLTLELPFLRFFDYIDDTGTPYATYDDLIDDLTELLGLGATALAGNPAGNDKEIQWNDNGVFGASPKFIWDDTNRELKISTDTLAANYKIDLGLDSILSTLGSGLIEKSGNSTFFGGVSVGVKTGLLISGNTAGVGNNIIKPTPPGVVDLGQSGERFDVGYFNTIDSGTLFGSVSLLVGSVGLDPSAVAHFKSTTKGMLVPRMTTTQRNAIQVPVESLLIYNTTTGNFEFNTEEVQTSGLLEIGKVYTIYNYIATDDFTNVGASSNVTGEIFTATGTTPTDWTNGSSLAVASENWEAVGQQGSVFATVSTTGADYPTLKEAVDDGKTRIAVIGDTTETADITLGAETAIYFFNNANVNMVNFSFLFSANNSTVDLSSVNGGEITFAYAATGYLFDNNAGAFSGIIHKAQGITFTNNSTSTSTHPTSGVNYIWNDVILNAADEELTGLLVDTGDKNKFYNFTLVGGGGANTFGSVLCDNANAQFDGFYIEGEFSDDVVFSGSSDPKMSINNLFVDITNTSIGVESSGIISNVTAFSGNIDLSINDNNTQVSNFKLGSAGALFTGTVDNCSFINFECNSVSVGSSEGSNGHYISNGKSTSLTTPEGDFNTYENLEITNAFSVGGINNTFNNCKIGTTGVGTITVNATADKTMVGGCRLGKAVVDGGTNTIQFGNTTF